VLDGDHPPRREALAVAVALHLVDDRHVDVAFAHEIGVQAVRRAVLRDGAAGGDERLPDHLTAEQALEALLGVAPAEEVLLDAFEVERGDEVADPLGRRRHQWASLGVSISSTRTPPMSFG